MRWCECTRANVCELLHKVMAIRPIAPPKDIGFAHSKCISEPPLCLLPLCNQTGFMLCVAYHNKPSRFISGIIITFWLAMTSHKTIILRLDMTLLPGSSSKSWTKVILEETTFLQVLEVKHGWLNKVWSYRHM